MAKARVRNLTSFVPTSLRPASLSPARSLRTATELSLARMPSETAAVSAISCEASGSHFFMSSSNSDLPSSLLTSPALASATSAPVTMSFWRSFSSAFFKPGTILLRMSSCEGLSAFFAPVLSPWPRKNVSLPDTTPL